MSAPRINLLPLQVLSDVVELLHTHWRMLETSDAHQAHLSFSIFVAQALGTRSSRITTNFVNLFI